MISNQLIYQGTTIARYEQSLLRGVRAAAQQRGCNVLLACGVGSDTTAFQALPAWPINSPHTNFVPVGPWNTGGLIAIPPFADAQLRLLQSVLSATHPLVFTHPQAGYPSVGPANSDGITQAFAHLMAHGHRRIAFMAANKHAHRDAAERFQAYRNALVVHGLPFER